MKSFPLQVSQLNLITVHCNQWQKIWWFFEPISTWFLSFNTAKGIDDVTVDALLNDFWPFAFVHTTFAQETLQNFYSFQKSDFWVLDGNNGAFYFRDFDGDELFYVSLQFLGAVLIFSEYILEFLDVDFVVDKLKVRSHQKEVVGLLDHLQNAHILTVVRCWFVFLLENREYVGPWGSAVFQNERLYFSTLFFVVLPVSKEVLSGGGYSGEVILKHAFALDDYILQSFWQK